MTRSVLYVSGTRADFGLMRPTLEAVAGHPRLALEVCVTGMHLRREYGHTVDEILAARFSVAARIPTEVDGGDGASMARGIGQQLLGLTDLLQARRPDLLLVLGDRGEMLAGAIAAMHVGVPVAHVCGGERSGTVDEPVRHAISKLAHLHFVSTEGARARLERMGEHPASIHVVGAPGLDGLEALADTPRQALCQGVGFDPGRPLCLFLMHPVVHSDEGAPALQRALLRTLEDAGLQVLALAPNSDAGGREMRAALEAESGRGYLRVRTHLERSQFVSWMAAADIMVGNSSSGIVEAASFGTPVLNLGVRQWGRERNANVRDLAADPRELEVALREALARGRLPVANIYGDGATSGRIASLLDSLPLDRSMLQKTNAY